MKAQLSHVHWGRILRTGVLVVILVIVLDTILSYLIFLVWGQLDHGQIASQVALWSTHILAFFLIVSGGVSVARRVERAAPLHGLLVGLVVALILFLLSRGFGDPVPVVLREFVLDVVAGWLGGVLGSRARKKTYPSGVLFCSH
jgi:putative membrane protein (TIGR04086 family)